MTRPTIKKSVKKSVRQKCGYGCVICGSPIVEYEHIEEWNVVKKHEESNLTLLCPSHHAEVTKKIIDKDFIRDKTKKPFNKGEKFTKKHPLYYRGDKFQIYLGTSLSEEKMYTNKERVILEVDGRSIITARFEDDNLLLNVRILNSHDEVVFEIEDNELIINAEQYDIVNLKNRFIVRDDEKTILEVELSPPSILKINKLCLQTKTGDFKVREGHIDFNGIKLYGCRSMYNGGAAFSFRG